MDEVVSEAPRPSARLARFIKTHFRWAICMTVITVYLAQAIGWVGAVSVAVAFDLLRDQP